MFRFCKACGFETERNSSRGCVICALAAQRRYHARNKDARNADNKTYREANKEELKKQQRERFAKRDKALAAEKMREYRAKHPERIKATNKRSYEKNPGLYISHALMREARTKQQTPAWADKEAINEIYKQCAEFRDAGIDCEVDHFYPLKGKRVSGLHCEFNLRIISRRENRSKSNRSPLDVTTPATSIQLRSPPPRPALP